MENLEGRIDQELADLHGRIDLISEDTKEHESRESRRRYLNEMSDKYSQRIEDLDIALSEDADDNKEVTWEQLQSKRGELSEMGQALLELYENGRDKSASDDHGRLKAECLDLIDKINDALLEQR